LYFLIYNEAKSACENVDGWYETKLGVKVAAGSDRVQYARIDRVYTAAIVHNNNALALYCSRYKKIEAGELPTRAAWWPVLPEEMPA